MYQHVNKSTVTSNVLTVTDENHKKCIFQILPVDVPRSYLFITFYRVVSE